MQCAAVMAHCSSMSEAPHTEPPVSKNRTQLCSNGVTGPPAEQRGGHVLSVLRAALESWSWWRTAHNAGVNTVDRLGGCQLGSVAVIARPSGC